MQLRACVQLRTLLEAKKVAYEEKDCSTDTAAREAMVAASGRKTLPQIHVGGKVRHRARKHARARQKWGRSFVHRHSTTGRLGANHPTCPACTKAGLSNAHTPAHTRTR